MLTSIYYPPFPKACKEFILQDRYLATLIFVFVYSKVGPNLKYSVFNNVAKKDVQLTYNCYCTFSPSHWLYRLIVHIFVFNHLVLLRKLLF